MSASLPPKDPDTEREAIALRHLRAGFWGLLAFLVLGVGLEVFHGLKLGFYLDVGNEARRLMWRLAHAHGALLSLIQLVFAVLVRVFGPRISSDGLISGALLAALLLIPGGFLAGGAFVHSGDPGVGVLLVPIGALFLAYAVLRIALGLTRRTP